MVLTLLPGRLAVCQLSEQAEIPAWATRQRFFSVTRTHDELSMICPEDDVPAGVRHERGWRALMLKGPFDFAAVGVLASLAQPLAAAGVSILVVATYDTDYILVKEGQLAPALAVLQDQGHTLDDIKSRQGDT